MVKGEIYKALEDDFAATFIRELMPGVLHNFANPLNGIMGRSKLLQRRIDDTVKKISEKYPETAVAFQDELQRIRNDIRSINKESDAFFDLFRDASGKFFLLAAKGEERVNLSSLLAAEMRFANFYLEFKHEIHKESYFEESLPDIFGNVAEWSLIFWRLIRFAMSRALASQSKEFFLETKHDFENVIVLLKYSGTPLPEADNEIITSYLEKQTGDMAGLNAEEGVLLAFRLLKKYRANVKFYTQNDQNVIYVTIGYKSGKG